MKRNCLWIKTMVFILAVGLVPVLSSCAKRQLGKTGAEGRQAGIEGQEKGQAGQQPGISEEELEAQRRHEAQVRAEEARKAESRRTFVNQDVHFDFDKATLTPRAIEILKEKVRWLRENPGVNVVIEGHTDERGTEEYNMALGQQRAQSIKTFLVNSGIDESRLQIVSYGEERPVDPRSNEEAWAKNRRGHFRILE